MQVESRVSGVNGRGIAQLQFPLSHAVKRDIRYGLGNRMKSQPLFQWPLGGELGRRLDPQLPFDECLSR